MKRNLYGKKMLIADLIFVSVWALFVGRICSSYLLLLIPMRIALCFEMDRKSPWTLVSAIGFLLAYLSADCFSKPFEWMFYVFFCSIGQSELMVEIFSQPFEWEMEAWIGSISALWFLWLGVLPVIIGFRLHNVREIQWGRKWIWFYLIPVTAVCVWIMFDRGHPGGYILGCAVSLLPMLYWSIYNRCRRSPVQLILSNVKVRWYLFYASFMLAAITIGLKDSYSFKFIGLLSFPALFYIMLTRSCRLGILLTRCCLALSFSGLLYWFVLFSGKTVSEIMLIIAVILIIYVGVIMIVRYKKWRPALALMTIVPFIIIPVTLGLNPYIILDADYTRMYSYNLSGRQGVYVVERDAELLEKGTAYYWCRMYGLRDRYGLILPMKYDEFNVLDAKDRYIVTKYPLQYGNPESDQRYGVFDLDKRKFVVNPDNIEVTEIGRIDDKSFKLINPEGRHFATLYLNGVYRGKYYDEARLEPHFTEGETSVAEFLGKVENVDLDIDDCYWKAMRQENPHAYRLLLCILEFGTAECSPASDMNYARAIKEIIQKDPNYKGNLSKALNDVEEVSEIMTDSGSQSSMNFWTYCRRLLSGIRVSLAYDSLMSSLTDKDPIKQEYEAWHNLIEAMACYQDYMYSFETYLAVPEHKNYTVMSWLNYRKEGAQKEQDIISGNLMYAVSPEKADSLRVEADFEELFSHFHRYLDPYYYHPMWNEVKTAFDQWRNARETIAERLEPHRSLSYREYTKEVVDSVFSCIEGLDWPGFRPALYPEMD